MSKEFLINCTPQETRVAVVEQGVVQELHVERLAHRGLVGNIYRGRIVRVLPGMQSAFVDVGLERTAFLHITDLWQAERHPESPPRIERLLAEGEEITEESWLTLPGNYPAYYAAIRDALNGIGVNPVPASQAIQIMELIELGLESARHRATLCLN